MNNDVAIDFRNVSEKYEIEVIADGKSVRESFEALRDISFSIRKGESVAVIGPNGAGKSTLLRIIAGLIRQEKGDVKVQGRVGSLLDLGAGFHAELTGKDNLFLNASLYNFSRDDLNNRYEQILKFADIGKFINVPVRCYSQGMYVRLAFSLAIHIDPDILLIDDCLAVGDDNFKLKSIDKALEFRARGKTIVFVTHDLNLARQLCSRGLLLKEGRIVKDADIEEIVSLYTAPLELDRSLYKYLGAKVDEEDEKRKLEEEAQRRAASEKRKQRHVLCGEPALKMIVAPGKVRIFHHDVELTHVLGIQTLFSCNGVDIGSGHAVWKVRKVTDTQLVCFLKWLRPSSTFQVWRFDLLSDGSVDWEVIMRSREFPAIENERVELWLKEAGGVLETDRPGERSRVLFLGQGAGITLETLRDDQVPGVNTDGKGFFRPFFLTVPDNGIKIGPGEKGERSFFKGRFSFGAHRAAVCGNVPASGKLTAGDLTVSFTEGSSRLCWGEKEATTGLGAYTSIYAKGIWYDSTQARWKLLSSSPRNLLAEGFWPWLPVSQIWEFELRENGAAHVKIKMKVRARTQIHMQETVLMLSDHYGEWVAGGERKCFSEEFTCDDLFRVCQWIGKSDGQAKVSAHGEGMPVVTFQPAALPGFRIIIENSAHIYNVKSRLFHCHRVNRDGQAWFEPGEYEFFEGVINVGEEKS